MPWVKKNLKNLYDKGRALSAQKKEKQGTSIRILCKASAHATFSGALTLEATLVFPIFMLVLLYFMFFFQVLMMEMHVEQALQYTSRTLAVYAGLDRITEEDTSAEAGSIREALKQGGTYFVSTQVAKHMVANRLKERGAETWRIENGVNGIHYTQTRMDGDYIDLVVSYKMKEPFSYFPKIRTIQIRQRVRARKWTGDHGARADGTTEETVYVTPTGTVYHRNSTCPYLDRVIRTTSSGTITGKRNKNGAKYYACQRCVKGNVTGTLYITDYGTRFHAKRNCTELDRSICAIPISQVSDRKPCSKCGEKERK